MVFTHLVTLVVKHRDLPQERKAMAPVAVEEVLDLREEMVF